LGLIFEYAGLRGLSARLTDRDCDLLVLRRQSPNMTFSGRIAAFDGYQIHLATLNQGTYVY